MITENVLEFYNDCRVKHGSNNLPLRHGWASEEGQKIRFQIIMGLLQERLDNVRVPIFDFGCGTGELFIHMHRAGIGSR